MPIHDLQNLIKWQDRHAIRMAFHNRQIDARKTLMIACSTPADCWERVDGNGTDVIEDPGATEYLGCWDSVLRGSKPFVETIPCLEHERGDPVL
jgi:hypothetical protein